MKTNSLQAAARVMLVLACIALTSCDAKKETAKVAVAETPETFEHARFLEVTPMSDGSAYVISTDFLLWYVRSNKAVRVTTPADASQKLPNFLEITPILDGAYATSLEMDSGLWYLHAEHAEKVTEVGTLGDAAKTWQIPEKSFYALYLSERKKRIDAER
ncbi:MAG: hypothetical protein EXS31_09620 [Pedosphaera sp.]|nr:hypothetical protein [Pedosphaera sp.]